MMRCAFMDSPYDLRDCRENESRAARRTTTPARTHEAPAPISRPSAPQGARGASRISLGLFIESWSFPLFFEGFESSNDELHSIRCRDVLPDAEHPPSLGPRHGGRLRIALDVPREFRFPVLGMRDRNHPVLGASVPEAAVDEDGETSSGEDDVRPTALIAPGREIDAVPVSARVQELTNRQLGSGVPTPIRLHRLRSARGTGPGASGRLAASHFPSPIIRYRQRDHRLDRVVSR